MNAHPTGSKMNVESADSVDLNLVNMWLKIDPIRWKAGEAAGLFAGLVTLVFAMIVSALAGYEFLFPAKLLATIVSGPAATSVNAGFGSVLTGVVVLEGLCLVLGLVFAHFVFTNSLQALLLMGLVWATFSWIFIWNLFFQSFRGILWAQIPSGAVFPICIVFGLALTSVAFFDRAFRGTR